MLTHLMLATFVLASVVLPDPISTIIGVVVLALVTEGLKALLAVFGVDLTGKGTVIAAAITTIIIFSINTIVAALPVDAQSLVAGLYQFLLVLLGAGGLWRTATRLGMAKK